VSSLLEIRGLVKDYQGLRPLRIRELTVTRDSTCRSPDSTRLRRKRSCSSPGNAGGEGEVIIFGQNTRDITDGGAG
jgi:hypothetical protein